MYYRSLVDRQNRRIFDTLNKQLQVQSSTSPENGRNFTMARLFMAGVATVDMFEGERHFGTANTLTDSSLNIGISAEDVRGGEGAGLLGKYFHTSTFDLTLTDALFDMNYIAASVGANIEVGSDVLINEEIKASNNTLTLTHTPVSITGCAGDTVHVWAKNAKNINGEYFTANKVAGKIVTDAGNISDGETYCVKYFYKNDSATKIRVDANYVPKTLHLVMKESLYAAGENSNSQTKVGYIIIDIPRFQLDGTQELSMNMSGASTTSLKGSAMISDSCNAGCEGAGYYAEMTQVLDGEAWYNGISALAVDGGTVTTKEATPIQLYAIYSGKTPKLITADMLEGLTTELAGNALGGASINGLTLTPGAGGAGQILLKKENVTLASGSITIAVPEA